MTIKIRIIRIPWLLRKLMHGRSITIDEVIFEGDDTDAQLIAHESEHVRQQDAMGWWPWVWRYVWHKDFRLDQEVRAFVAEMAVIPQYDWPRQVRYFAADLAGSGYLHAAPSVQAAKEVLCAALGIPVPEDPTN